MHQIYPDGSLLELLKRIANGDLHFHLFMNNATIDRATVLGDLTEASFTGYSVVTVAATDFALSGVTSHLGSLVAAPISFTNGSGSALDAYGYFATNTADDKLLAVAKFDTADRNKPDGGSWLVTPFLGNFSNLAS